MNAQATQAVGEFYRPQRLEYLSRSTVRRPGTDALQFEAPFAVRFLAGADDKPNVIASAGLEAYVIDCPFCTVEARLAKDLGER
jgi:hypothetical protein